MNITIPPAGDASAKYPVMAYIHGGSWLYGGANLSIFDGVNFVSHSVEKGTPVVALNFNYRVGLGGFLASSDIQKDLAKDGYEGVGNFGLTDQQVALEWVQKNISQFSGDTDNVTIYGESAGGISVAHQMVAKNPSIFHRAIAQSGALNTLETWTLERHEKHYQALLRAFKIDGKSQDALEQLRALPDNLVAAATLKIEGCFVASGNACYDGVFHKSLPSVARIDSPPSWVKSFMTGETYDEGIIFRFQVIDDDYKSLYDRMKMWLSEEEALRILQIYNITPDLPALLVRLRWEEMISDCGFRWHNYLALHSSKVPTYAYHFDQKSTLENPLKGTAYHAIDLFYLFLNGLETMTPGQTKLAKKVADDWIDFSYGKAPWEEFSIAHKGMVYGPDDTWQVKTEEEDEPVRQYLRMKDALGAGTETTEQYLKAMDDFSLRRWLMGAYV